MSHRTLRTTKSLLRGTAGLLLAAVAALTLAPSPASATSVVSAPMASVRADDRGAGLRPFSGDFDGDRQTDIFWYGPGAAPDHIEFGGATPAYRSYTITGNYLPFSGDFDGDKKDDIFWYAPGPAPDSVWFSRGRDSFGSLPFQVNGTFTPLVGRFTSDPTDDVLWYAPGSAPDSMWDFEVNRSVTRSMRSINGTYKPVVANLSDTVGGVAHKGVDDIFWAGATPQSASTLWLTRSDGSVASTSLWVGGGTVPTFAPMASDFDRRCTTSATPLPPANPNEPPVVPPSSNPVCWDEVNPAAPVIPTLLLTAPGKKDVVITFSNGSPSVRDVQQAAWGTTGGTRLPLLDRTGTAMAAIYTYGPASADNAARCTAPTACGSTEATTDLGAGYIPLRFGPGGAEVVLYHPTRADVRVAA